MVKLSLTSFINSTLFKTNNQKTPAKPHNQKQPSKEHILLLGYHNPPTEKSTGQVY